ncbi:MAG: hypothetical protein AB1546_15785 [bacterium]
MTNSNIEEIRYKMLRLGQIGSGLELGIEQGRKGSGRKGSGLELGIENN